MLRRSPGSPLFPYTTLFRSRTGFVHHAVMDDLPDLSAWEVYACGNPQMVEGARRDFIQHCQLDDEAYFSRSEEHTSELQSRGHLVCRLLLEKKKKHDETDPT